jgi:ATP dependent DNA ligase domain
MIELPYQYQPQLALRVKDDKIPLYHHDDGYASDIKLDGVRYILHNPINGEPRAYSRGYSTVAGKRTDLLVDKSGQLAHLLADLDKYWPKGTVLDGEAFFPGVKKSFKNVTPITLATPENAERIQVRSGNWIQYYVFDILAEDGEEYVWYASGLSQEERWHQLRNTFGPDKQMGNLHLCQPVYGTENKSVHLQQCLDLGFEGVIYKQLEGLYVPDKRDKRWVKDKPQRDYQVVFMGVEWAKLESIKKGDTSSTPTRFIQMAKQHDFDRIVGAIKYGQYVRISSLLATGADVFSDGAGVSYELRELGKVSGIDDTTRLDITRNWESYSSEKRVFDLRAQTRHEETLALREPQFDRWRDDLDPTSAVVEESE